MEDYKENTTKPKTEELSAEKASFTFRYERGSKLRSEKRNFGVDQFMP